MNEAEDILPAIQDRAHALISSFSSEFSRFYKKGQVLRAEEYECRLCKCGDRITSLISPCLCDGTMKWVHVECLEEYRLNQGTLECDICERPFAFKAKGKTLKLIEILVNSTYLTSVLIGFPYAYSQSNWPLMTICCFSPMFSIYFHLEIANYPTLFVVTNRASQLYERINVVILTIAFINILILFCWYCTFLTWSIQPHRFFPAIISLIISEVIAVSGAGIIHLLVGLDQYDEDIVFNVTILAGLVIWSIIHVEVSL